MFSPAAKKLAGNALILSLSRIVNIACRASYLILAARLLGPDLYGLFVYSQSWYLVFIPFANLGLRSILLRQVGQYGKGAVGEVQQALFFTLCSCVLSSMAAACLGSFFEPNQLVRQAVFVFSLALLMRSLYLMAETVFLAYEEPRVLLPISIVFRPAEAIAGIAALLLGYGLLTLAWIHTISWGLQALAAYAIAIRRGIMPPLVFPARSGLRLLAQAFPLLIGGVLMGQIQQGPILYFRWQGGEGLGQLSILIQLVNMLGIIPISGLQALLPAMTRKHVRSANEARNIGKKIISLCFLGGTSGALVAMVLAPTVLTSLMGDQYSLALRHMGLAVALLGLYSAALTVNQLQTVRKNYTSVLYAISAGAGCMILGYVFVRPEHSVLALCLWGLGYVGWLLTGAHMLGLLLFVTKWLTFCGAVVALPYAFGFKAWSILVSALVLSGLSIYSNRHHVPILLQKIMKSFH